MILFKIFLAAFVIFSLPHPLYAETYPLKEVTPEVQEILSAQKDRRPIVEQLKLAGIVGENASGYLQVLKAAPEVDKVVEKENNGRKRLYRIIARQHRLGDSVGAVEQSAASLARKNARKGEFIQLPTGRWTPKGKV